MKIHQKVRRKLLSSWLRSGAEMCMSSCGSHIDPEKCRTMNRFWRRSASIQLRYGRHTIANMNPHGSEVPLWEFERYSRSATEGSSDQSARMKSGSLQTTGSTPRRALATCPSPCTKFQVWGPTDVSSAESFSWSFCFLFLFFPMPVFDCVSTDRSNYY